MEFIRRGWVLLALVAIAGCEAPVLLPQDAGARDAFSDDGPEDPRDGGMAGDAAGDAGTSLPPACAPSPEPPPPVLGPAYYFSDCATGAQAGCVPGLDSNPGTSADAPRRSPESMALDDLPAGTQLLFARGGAWADARIIIRNGHATPESPIVFAPYSPSWGGTDAPLIRGASEGGTLEFGVWATMEVHGGYVVRGLHLHGGGVGMWGIWVRDGTSYLSVLDTEVEAFEIGMHIQSPAELPTRHVTLRGNDVHHNSSMGILGSADDLLVEGNRVSFNNASGSPFSHGILLSGGRRAVIRDNRVEQNSVVDGRCTGGNLTMHGQWEDVLVEGNQILQERADPGCFGMLIGPGFETAEWFREVVVRGNVVVNLGWNAIAVSAAPGIVIEDNLIVNDQAQYGASIFVGHPELAPVDDTDHDAIVRNNTIVRSHATSGTPGISVSNAGPGVVVVSNLVSFLDAADGACFEHGDVGLYATFSHNLCHGAPFSSAFATLAEASAAGFGAEGVEQDPAFAALPSVDNGWTALLSDGSPAIDRGHPTLSSTTDRACTPRSTPDIGAYER